MVLSWLAISLLMLAFICCSAEGNPESGPFTVKLDHVSACNDSGSKDVIYDMVKEYEDGDETKPCFTGNITLNREINDDLSYKIFIDIMKNETWKEYLSFNFMKSCTHAKRYEENFFQMLKKININVNDCPIPKGVYSFKCVNLDGQEFKSQKTMKYGRYRIRKYFMDKSNIIGCIYGEANVSPL